MDSVSTYRPFYEDVATSGIYVSQRGLRYLGHLLYHWSRVHAHIDLQEKRTDVLLTVDSLTIHRYSPESQPLIR